MLRWFATSTRAREEQADKLFREIIEIADDASGDYVTTSDGKRIVDHENIQRSRRVSMPASGRQPDSRPGPARLFSALYLSERAATRSRPIRACARHGVLHNFASAEA
jgi:hypothetical protein